MDTCECGNTIDGYSAQCARCRALQALNLGKDATDKEIKSAYRILVRVCHPDLFEYDKEAKALADEKIRSINAAFRLLSTQPHPETPPEAGPEFFTIGSTRKDVLAVQGIPTAYSTDTFEYGSSRVFFVGDKVVGWENAPVRIRLNVQLQPRRAVDQGMHYIATGLSKDEVLAVQGTPTGFSHDTYEYGMSRVHFRDGKVVSWENDPAWIPLRVQPH
ncbi:MAG: J domain-containing protein [Acidobacteriaceae bacterium]